MAAQMVDSKAVNWVALMAVPSVEWKFAQLVARRVALRVVKMVDTMAWHLAAR